VVGIGTTATRGRRFSRFTRDTLCLCRSHSCCEDDTRQRPLTRRRRRRRRRPTNCYATAPVNAIDHQPRPHRLHTASHSSHSLHYAQTRPPAAASKRPRQSRHCSLPIPSPSHHCSTSQSALTERAVSNALAHVPINLGLRHKQRRRRAPCPLEV
jgi:hypothetical protein